MSLMVVPLLSSSVLYSGFIHSLVTTIMMSCSSFGYGFTVFCLYMAKLWTTYTSLPVVWLCLETKGL